MSKKQKLQTKVTTKTTILVGAAILGIAGLSYAAATIKLTPAAQAKIKTQATTNKTIPFTVKNNSDPLASITNCDVTNELKKYYPMASPTATMSGSTYTSYGEGPYSFYMKAITVMKTTDKKGNVTGASARVYYKKKWGETKTYYNDWTWIKSWNKPTQGYFNGNRTQKTIYGPVPPSTCASVSTNQKSEGSIIAPTTNTTNNGVIIAPNAGTITTPGSSASSVCKSSGNTITCTYELKPVSGKGGACPTDNTGLAFLTKNNCTGLSSTKIVSHTAPIPSSLLSKSRLAVNINLKTNYTNYTAIWDSKTKRTTGSYSGARSEYNRLEISNIAKSGNNITFNTIFYVGQKYDNFKESNMTVTIAFSGI
ncbi:MAG TPA: hypothetical protein P5096_01960 [Patescibacteria group bacterium]|nr:hypothetical protein [Patescibacteria group bacterium]